MVHGHNGSAPTHAPDRTRALPNEAPFRVTHILLDVDGTLVDSSGATQAAETALARRCSVLTNREVTAVDVAHLRRAVSEDPQWCGAAVNAIRHEALRRLLAKHGIEDEAAVQEVLHAFIEARTQALKVFADVCASLAALRALGVVLIAASNGNVDLERFGLAEYVSGTHYASEVGVSKPDPRFFALALQRFDIPARSALVVGDRVDNDYEPSRLAGLHAVLLDRPGEITDPSITRITALSELPALIAAQD